MRFGGESFSEREGFFVRVEGSHGIGIGEVAPLPGVHRETVLDCLAALGAHRSEASTRQGMPPSLAFGLSVATALAAGDPVLCRPLRPVVGVNELVADDRLPSDDARTVKVKVGRRPLAEERSRILEILRVRPQVRLRLDANRSLSLDDAKRLCEGLDPARIDYLEEPLRTPLDLPALHFATGMPIALDESLHDSGLRSALETAPGVVVHVVKPSLIGDLRAVRERAERTARQGLRTTITSTFESSYTLYVLARLITWLPAANDDHGLGTGGMLLDDPCEPPTMSGWTMSTEQPIPVPSIAFEPWEATGA
jgi:o-succinylbenzoate synthase